MSNTAIVNATIDSASIQMDRGSFLSCWVFLDYGGSQQGFGGYVLGGEPGIPAGDHAHQPNLAAEFIVSCLRAAEVESFDKLAGKTVRVEREAGLSGRVLGIGHITKDDRWFYPEARFDALLIEHVQQDGASQ